jgi:hypothetical protein
MNKVRQEDNMDKSAFVHCLQWLDKSAVIGKSNPYLITTEQKKLFRLIFLPK